MPAFTFEKISPPNPRSAVSAPANPASAAPSTQKPRGMIVQLFSRLTETRAQRVEQSIAARREHDPK